MADPNSSEFLDETLAPPASKAMKQPTSTSSPSTATGNAGDFSDWTWTAETGDAQTLPLDKSDSSARPTLDAPDHLDETLVHSPINSRSEAPMPPELDHTLVNPPSLAIESDSTTSGLDATLLKPTRGPQPLDTHAPQERDNTLTDSPTSAGDPNATLDPLGSTLDAPATEVRPDAAATKPGGGPRPTGVPGQTSPMPVLKNRKGPSFHAEGDRYEVLGTLGRGGMGVVYKARDRQLNRLVALKMILSGAHASSETLNRFKIEAEAVAKLQHPNIVQIFDIGERDGHPFFSLEYLDGGSLHQKLDGIPQPPKQAAIIVETLARAINYAHQRGIVHRDMKPANVLIGGDGTLKITDFGLAKQLDIEDSGQTGTESILGTPTYMAPEQAAGRTKAVGPPADIYALGAMLYEMLTGRPPFRGTTVMETLQQVQFIEPVQPRRLQPNAPVDLQTICLKCLNKEPQKRYETAEALADDLRAYLDNRPIKARPISAPERVYKWARRQPMQAALVAVSFCTVVGLFLGILNNMRQESALRKTAEQNEALAVAAKKTEEQRRVDAENAKVAIEKERDEKESARKLAVENGDLAVANEKRAKANFKQAKEAVDQLTSLAQQSLADRPGLEKVRDDLLNSVVRYYEEFIQKNKDENLTLDKGQAYRRLGDVQQMLGKNDAAAASYQQAIDSFNELLAKDDKNKEARRELAETFISQWVVLTDLGKAEAASSALDQAYPILKELLVKFPGKANYALDLAMCDNDFAIRAYFAGQSTDAEQHALEALKYLSEAKGTGKDPTFRLEEARAHDTLGLLYTARASKSANPESERSKAADQFALALTAAKPLVEHSPETTKYAKTLGEIYTNLGILLKSRQDKSGAQSVYNEAIALFEDLNKKYPDVTDYRHLLALNRGNRGILLGQEKKYEAARMDLEYAALELGKLAALFPRRAVFRFDQAGMLNNLGVVLEASQASEGARQAWEQAEKLLQVLVDTQPKRDDYRNELVRSLDYLILSSDRDAKLAFAAKSWADAAAATVRLLAVRERMAALNPSEQAQSALASTRLHLAEMYIAASNTSEAGSALTAFWNHRKEIPRTWGQLNRAAAVVCQYMDLADRDNTLPPIARTRLREEWTGQCLLLLRDAIDQNEKIEIRPEDFKSLRENPDFKDMVAEIERNRKKAASQ